MLDDKCYNTCPQHSIKGELMDYQEIYVSAKTHEKIRDLRASHFLGCSDDQIIEEIIEIVQDKLTVEGTEDR